jgi:hypothetical protein
VSRFDDAVDEFIISKFMSNDGRLQMYETNNAYRYSYEADGGLSDIKVLQADMGWECACYSSWTRDDTFEITALIKTKSREVQFVYGTWRDFPDLITELDEYINNDACYYESEEYNS